jgi:hypothetical protein
MISSAAGAAAAALQTGRPDEFVKKIAQNVAQTIFVKSKA